MSEKKETETQAKEKDIPMRVREAYTPNVDGVWLNGVRIDPKKKELTDGE
jgi:hypothetical protein